MTHRVSLKLFVVAVLAALCQYTSRAQQIPNAAYVSLVGSISASNGIPARNFTLSFTPTQPMFVPTAGLVNPRAANCSTDGNGLIVGLANPSATPIVAASYTGLLPPGNYFVAVAWVDQQGNSTAVSPEVTVQLTQTGAIVVGPPSTGYPQGSVGMRVYVGTSAGTGTLQGSATYLQAYTQSIPLVNGTPRGSNLTVCRQVANDAMLPIAGYNVSLIDSKGNAVAGYPQKWQFIGPGTTINVGNGVPKWNGQVSYQLGTAGPPGCFSAAVAGTCTDNLTPRVLSGSEVHVQQYPGAGLEDKINAARQVWDQSPNPVTFVVDNADTISKDVALGVNQSIWFKANMLFGPNATGVGANMYFSGHNRAYCSPGVVISTQRTVEYFPFVAAVSPAGVPGDWGEIDHCQFVAPVGSAAGVFRTQGTSHHRFHDNVLTDIAGIILALQPDDIQVYNNIITGTGAGLAPASLMGMIGGTPGKATNFDFAGNKCKNVTYCGFINAGDAGSVGSRADAMAGGGNHVFWGNSCDTVFSCTWTGAGSHIVMSGNVCRHAIDQCYDLEGDVDSLITGNVAYNDATAVGGNGLNASASLFRYSDNNTISGNLFTQENGQPSIVIKNSSADPTAFLNTMVQGNTISCKVAICEAIYTEAASGTRFVDNIMVDARVSLATLTVNGSINPEVSRNSFAYTMKSPYAIRIKTDYGRTVVDSNTITGEVAEDAGTVGIDVIYTYGNLFPSVFVTNNKQFALFPIDLRMNNTSTNTALGADTTFSGNWARSNNVVYSNPNGRPGTFKELSRFIPDGARNWKLINPALAGTGNAYSCVDASGSQYRSSTACQ